MNARQIVGATMLVTPFAAIFAVAVASIGWIGAATAFGLAGLTIVLVTKGLDLFDD